MGNWVVGWSGSSFLIPSIFDSEDEDVSSSAGSREGRMVLDIWGKMRHHEIISYIPGHYIYITHVYAKCVNTCTFIRI